MTGVQGGAPAPPAGAYANDCAEALAAFDDAREDWNLSGFPRCEGPLWEAYVAGGGGVLGGRPAEAERANDCIGEWAMSAIRRMNLTGLDPKFYASIKRAAEEVIRNFSGSPEDVPEFQEAQRILTAMYEIEAER